MITDRPTQPASPEPNPGIPGEFQPQLSLMCHQGTWEQWAARVDETQASLRSHAKKLMEVGDALERGESVDRRALRKLLADSVGDLQHFWDLMGYPFVAARLRIEWWLLLDTEID
jgi:hypothetical protein